MKRHTIQLVDILYYYSLWPTSFIMTVYTIFLYNYSSPYHIHWDSISLHSVQWSFCISLWSALKLSTQNVSRHQQWLSTKTWKIDACICNVFFPQHLKYGCRTSQLFTCTCKKGHIEFTGYMHPCQVCNKGLCNWATLNIQLITVTHFRSNMSYQGSSPLLSQWLFLCIRCCMLLP